MIPAELEKPRVTEIQVPMDCNGCVQKIKKALHGINGIYDIYFDLPQQKITIIGWADPEKIVKAIKKTRKIATICSHLEATLEQPPEGGAPPLEAPPTEPPPPPDAASPPAPSEGDPPPHFRPKDVEEIHVVYHHPPDYAHRYRPEPLQYRQYSRPEPPQYTQYGRPEPPQYTQYGRPEPPQYTQYGRPEPPQYTQYRRPEPPQHVHYSRTEPVTQYTHYSRPEPSQYIHHDKMNQYSEDYRHSSNNGNGNGNGNITSVFSDENPNACRIV